MLLLWSCGVVEVYDGGVMKSYVVELYKYEGVELWSCGVVYLWNGDVNTTTP